MLLAPILVCFLGSAFLFAWKTDNERARGACSVALTLAASALALCAIFTDGAHAITLLRVTDTLTFSLRLDGLGRVFGALVSFLWPLATLYALEYMRGEGALRSFFGFYLLSFGVTLGIAFAEDLMTLYVFYELLTLATLFLVLHGMSARGVYAGRKYVYYSLGGAALGFIALAFVTHYAGSPDFTAGGAAELRSAPLGALLPIFALGFMGFGVKAAVFPLHSWLPTASVAPTPVTSLLHAVAVVKAGAFAVIRLTYYCVGAELLRGTWAQYACMGVALVSILFGSVMAVKERHLKRRLAYSTMSNLSYVFLGAMLMTSEGLRGGLMHMVFHALMKISLFSCAGAIIIKTGAEYVGQLRGMARRMPFTMAVFLFCSVSLVGIPPFIGFQSKWALAEAAIASGGVMGAACVITLLISAVLTAIYMLVPAISAYMSPPEGAPDTPADPGWRMKLPLALLCLIMLALAFYSEPLVDYLGAAIGL